MRTLDPGKSQDARSHCSQISAHDPGLQDASGSIPNAPLVENNNEAQLHIEICDQQPKSNCIANVNKLRSSTVELLFTMRVEF